MKIEILGTGCAKCNLLERTAKTAADSLGLTYELTHVTDLREFVRRGVMLTPAMSVDGTVVVAGRVPSESELRKILQQAAAGSP